MPDYCVFEGEHVRHLVRTQPTRSWRGQTWCGRLGEDAGPAPTGPFQDCQPCQASYDRAQRLGL